MSKSQDILDRYPDADWIFAEGFDDAIIGISDERIVYSVSKCIEILMKEHNMSDDDAVEYFDFNVSSAYVGEKTPIWVDLF